MTNSIISKSATIGKNVKIGNFCTIYDNVEIADNTIVEDYCVLGIPNSSAKGNLKIGANSHIRSHSVFYQGSIIGDELKTGHHILVRENNFIGRNLQLGSYSELEGSLTIKDYVRIHSKVQMARKVEIGHFSYIFPRFQTSDDPLPPSHVAKPPKIGNMCVIAINSILMPGVSLGAGSFVGAASVVKSDVPPAVCVAGNPAVKICRIDQLREFKNKISHPWHLHFKDSYPQSSYELMDKVVEEVNDEISKIKNSN